MRCTKCGHKMRIGDEFCSKCGTPIEPDIIYEKNDPKEGHTKKYRGLHDDDLRQNTRDDGRFRSNDDQYNNNYYDHYNDDGPDNGFGAYDEFSSGSGYDKYDRYDKYDQAYGDRTEENKHDITGEVDLQFEDSTAKKASKWTSKGVLAAVGIAAAFVIAIIAINVQNAFKPNDDAELREAQETEETTTVTETTETEASDDTSGGSKWKNPFGSLYRSGDDNSGSSDNSGNSGYSGNGNDSGSSNGSDSYSYEDDNYNYGRQHGQQEDSYNPGNNGDYGSSSDNSESYTDIYGDDTYSDNYYDHGYENTDPGVIEFFEDVGGKIIDSAGDYGGKIDESINKLWDMSSGNYGW